MQVEVINPRTLTRASVLVEPLPFLDGVQRNATIHDVFSDDVDDVDFKDSDGILRATVRLNY